MYESLTLPTAAVGEDLNKVWSRFNNIFATINGLLNFRPVFADYYYEALAEFNQDNVQHLEFRGLLPQVITYGNLGYKMAAMKNSSAPTLKSLFLAMFFRKVKCLKQTG